MFDKLKAAGRGIDSKYEEIMALFAMLSMNADNRAQNGIVETVIVTVVVGIVGLVGILIFSEVDGAIEVPTDHALNSTADGLAGGFGSAMELLPVVLIVLIASLVIIVIGGMRAR